MHKRIIKAEEGVPLNLDTSFTKNLYSLPQFLQRQTNPVASIPATSSLNMRLDSPTPNLNYMPQQDMALGNMSKNVGFGDKLKGMTLGQSFDKTGVGKFANNWGGVASGVAEGVTNMLQPKQNGDPLIQSIGGTASGIMGYINPVAGLANSGSNLLNAGLGKAFGKSTDYSDKAGQIFDKSTDVLNMLGPLGMAANFALDFGNMLGSKKVGGVNVTDTAKELRGSYEGSISQGEGLGTKNFSGLSRIGGSDKRYKNKVAESQRKINLIDTIGTNARDDFAASNNPLAYNNLQMSRTGGYQSTAIGRKGMKIFTNEQKDFVKRVLTKEVTSFKAGGAINVIPEGELHSRKHNMDVEGITSKGIPVVTEESGGSLKQQAEIERNEIIFNLNVTKKLEKLMKEDSDDAAIEAGKLLVMEILHNTEDRTGLLNEID